MGNPLGREAVYSAFFAQLKAALVTPTSPFNYAGRRPVPDTDLAEEQYPAFFMMEAVKSMTVAFYLRLRGYLYSARFQLFPFKVKFQMRTMSQILTTLRMRLRAPSKTQLGRRQT